MDTLDNRLKIGKFNIMQLRARGLPTTRNSTLIKEIEDLRTHILALNQHLATKGAELENVVAQRDAYGRRLLELTT